MAAFDFRPRTSTELLDASVEFVRRHFGILAATLALAQIPVLAITFAFPPSPTDPFLRLREQPALALLIILASVWIQSTLGVTFIHIVDDLLHGRSASLPTALRLALARSGSALVTMLLTYIVLILWAALFVIPVIWAYARYFAVLPAFTVEKLSPLAAIRRSKELAKGNNGRAIGLGLAPAVVGGVIMALIQQGLLGAGVAFMTVRVIGALLTIVLYPFTMVPAIFLYYDLRTRREGLDLDLDSLSASHPTAAA
jgi:uncharacterized membrane protein